MALPYATVGQLLKLEEKLSKSSGGSSTGVQVSEMGSTEDYIKFFKAVLEQIHSVLPQYFFDAYYDGKEPTEEQKEELVELAKSHITSKIVSYNSPYVISEQDENEFVITADTLGVSEKEFTFLLDLVKSLAAGTEPVVISIRGDDMAGWDQLYLAFVGYLGDLNPEATEIVLHSNIDDIRISAGLVGWYHFQQGGE